MLKFMFGAMVGAALALLLAPKSGEELREDVSNQLNDKIEQGKTMARKVSRRARELGEQAQEQMRRVDTSLSAE
jgi:gas vesicle protein